MWNKPTAEELAQLPKLYETERTPVRNKIVQMHFFIGGCDWYVVEFDGEDTFFCFAILNDDLECAEWSYASLSEMEAIDINGLEIDRDLFWKPIPVREIERLSGLVVDED